MNRSRKNAIVGMVLIAVTALAAFFFYRLERSHQREIAEISETGPVLEDSVASNSEPASAAIFTPNPDPANPGDLRLESKSETIAAGDDVAKAQQIVAAVLRGLQNTVPPQARVRQVYLLEDGTAVVDLSRETSEQLRGGVSSEIGVIASITRSLIENLPAVKQVRFLIEGEQRPTFSGHVSLSQPFL